MFKCFYNFIPTYYIDTRNVFKSSRSPTIIIAVVYMEVDESVIRYLAVVCCERGAVQILYKFIFVDNDSTNNY